MGCCLSGEYKELGELPFQKESGGWYRHNGNDDNDDDIDDEDTRNLVVIHCPFVPNSSPSLLELPQILVSNICSFLCFHFHRRTLSVVCKVFDEKILQSPIAYPPLKLSSPQSMIMRAAVSFPFSNVTACLSDPVIHDSAAVDRQIFVLRQMKHLRDVKIRGNFDARHLALLRDLPLKHLEMWGKEEQNSWTREDRMNLQALSSTLESCSLRDPNENQLTDFLSIVHDVKDLNIDRHVYSHPGTWKALRGMTIKNLSLNGNQYKNPEFDLSMLQTLSFETLKIRDAIVTNLSSLANIHNLTKLNFRFCQLSLNALGNITQLKELVLHLPTCDTPFLDLKFLNQLKNLESFSLVSDAFIKGWEGLKDLPLRHLNLFANVPNSLLTILQNQTLLEDLQVLPYNEIENEKHYRKLSNLHILSNFSLRSLTLKNYDLTSCLLPKLPFLHNLRLFDSNLNPNSLIHMKGQGTLMSLDLSGSNGVDNRIVSILATLPKLRELHLAGTEVTPKAFPLFRYLPITYLSMDNLNAKDLLLLLPRRTRLLVNTYDCDLSLIDGLEKVDELRVVNRSESGCVCSF